MRTFPIIAAAVLTIHAIGGSTLTAAPAPPLTSVSVVGVASTQGGTEYPPPGAIATRLDHGGPELLIAVQELGYSQLRIAHFNGMQMAEIASQPILNCNLVVGYYRYYYIDTPFTSGTFTYSSQSMVVPFKQFSLRLLIR